MKSRRLHRVRTAQRQAQGVLDTYRNSSRGLMRVFTSILTEGDPSGGAAAARASHHLAEVEAHLPKIREAIRSCRYPGAEHGDTHMLLWGLWGQLSEAQLHFRGALESLQALGRLSRPASMAPSPSVKAKRARKGRKSAAKAKTKTGAKTKAKAGKSAAKKTAKRRPKSAKKPSRTAKRTAGGAAGRRSKARKIPRKPAGGRKSAPRSGR